MQNGSRACVPNSNRFIVFAIVLNGAICHKAKVGDLASHRDHVNHATGLCVNAEKFLEDDKTEYVVWMVHV